MQQHASVLCVLVCCLPQLVPACVALERYMTGSARPTTCYYTIWPSPLPCAPFCVHNLLWTTSCIVLCTTLLSPRRH